MDVLLIGGRQHRLVFPLEFVEALIGVRLLPGFGRPASEHLVEESHDLVSFQNVEEFVDAPHTVGPPPRTAAQSLPHTGLLCIMRYDFLTEVGL